MNELYADIILFDTSGSPYTGQTVHITGMGGSEFQAILLLEAMAAVGKKVVCLNNTTETIEHNGVLYLPNISVANYQFKCNHLIIHRTSFIPRKIQHKKCYQWVTDLNGPQNLPFYDLLESGKCKLVTLSNFSNEQFPITWDKHVINFMIPDWVYNYPTPENKSDFIYASSIMKGYNATLQYWSYFKNNGYLKDKKLHVCLPGYDNPPNDISIQQLDVNYLGTLTFKDVVETMSKCEGMFYVNNVPETFCISAVLAEILKTTPYIYCLNGIGALNEVLKSNTVTTNIKAFMDDIKACRKVSVEPNQYRPNRIILEWLKLFND